MTRLGPLVAILACCGVKLLLVGAVLAPAGFLTSNLVLGLLGLIATAVLVALAARSRSTCSGGCHAPTAGAVGPALDGERR